MNTRFKTMLSPSATAHRAGLATGTCAFFGGSVRTNAWEAKYVIPSLPQALDNPTEAPA
jgi:hypothetical protein